MLEMPDVLCINCEDMIDCEKAHLHSLICTKPTNQVVKLISSGYHNQIQYKLNRLKAAIEAIAYSDRKTLTPDQHETVLFLVKCSNELINLIDPAIDAIDKCTDVSSSMRKLTESMSPWMLIYAERLRNLALEKTYYFLDYLRNNRQTDSIHKFIDKKNQELSQVKSKIVNYNKKAVKLQNMLKSYEHIDEVKSQVESIKTFSSIVTPAVEDEGKDEMQELDDMIVSKKEEANMQSLEDLKKYFYSKCLLVKLSFPSRHPAQFIQIPELYEKIVKSNVPVEKWEECIRDEFSHPERWVNLKVVNSN